MMNFIELKNINKSYGKNQQYKVLKGINLTIQQGESVAIVGKSGSGKSTLMHILALLDIPTSGSIVLNSMEIEALKEKKVNQIRNEQFGFVFQQFFMKPKDTVLNNVLLPLQIASESYKLSAKQRKIKVLEALEAVDLKEKTLSRAADLSGGQKQRVCIARALVNNPGVIFADESTGNLDSKTSDKIQTLLFDINKAKGITLVVVTHDDDFAKKFDRQFYLQDGEIIKEYSNDN